MNSRPKDIISYLKSMDSSAFKVMGVNEVAYIREVNRDGHLQYALHAADGTELMTNASKQALVGTVIENDLHTVTIH